MNQNTKQKRSAASWLAELAKGRYGEYALSVLTALLGVACSLIPYFIIIRLIDGEDLSPESEDISLCHVDFSYDSKPILHDVSLTIPEKTTVAIVGPSGSGKTTLCNLMARFWDVRGGSVRLGGRDVREYS